jgi:hypothetical protein
MTRTDRILAAISAALERRRASLDADEATQSLMITVKLNDGGFPKLIEVERHEKDDLTAIRARA